jgi:hypothetical protein
MCLYNPEKNTIFQCLQYAGANYERNPGTHYPGNIKKAVPSLSLLDVQWISVIFSFGG